MFREFCVQRGGMSKYNNVNPDHYKVAGRERPGHAVAKAPKAMAELEEARARWQEKQAKQLPKKGHRKGR
ncbi:MAG TPA: hypothetical protein VGQ16_07685 [Vicinamibacterales bacterium]|nr:hypothetical protein [Vicinamibacterales bacterium]